MTVPMIGAGSRSTVEVPWTPVDGVDSRRRSRSWRAVSLTTMPARPRGATRRAPGRFAAQAVAHRTLHDGYSIDQVGYFLDKFTFGSTGAHQAAPRPALLPPRYRLVRSAGCCAGPQRLVLGTALAVESGLRARPIPHAPVRLEPRSSRDWVRVQRCQCEIPPRRALVSRGATGRGLSKSGAQRLELLLGRPRTDLLCRLDRPVAASALASEMQYAPVRLPTMSADSKDLALCAVSAKEDKF